jgi:hypothetical protein
LIGAQFENSSDIGVFAKLTNAYCLLSYGGSEHFKVIENELADHIPIVNCSIAGCRIVGRLTAGKHSSLHTANVAQFFCTLEFFLIPMQLFPSSCVMLLLIILPEFIVELRIFSFQTLGIRYI